MPRSIALSLVLACLLPVVIPAVLIAAPADGLQDELNQALAHRAEEAASKIRLLRKMETQQAEKTANQDLYDAIHYDLDLTLDPSIDLLTGTVAATVSVTGASIATLDLNLHNNMAIAAVRVGGVTTSYAHSLNILTITLDRAYLTGETLTVEVDYQGNPAGDYFGWASYGGSDMIWTLSEPFGAREWWPCKDINTDKADSLDITVTVPQNLIVASNGLIVSDTTGGGLRTTHWKTNYPIVTYLVSLAIHPYQTFSTWYAPLGGGDPMEIQHYVFADQFSSAQTAYASTDEMMTVFANAFGEYPFVDEKYGHASFTWGGGMEHQTLSSMGGLWEDVIAHELGHQWWGDMVTCADFHHIWLNEGFATWTEAYWKEQSEGVSTYRAYMDAAAFMGPGTIYVEDLSNFWSIFDSNLSYNKASWVVHMLRGVMGDADFFAGLAAFRAAYEFDSATTEQFRDVMETVTTRDLDAFFLQWIYGEYFPVYSFGWSQVGSDVLLDVDQVQTNAGLFTMPIVVRVTTDQGVFDSTIENALASESYVIPVTGVVESVVLDPDDWILCQFESAVTSPSLDQGILVVNGVDWNTYSGEIEVCYEDSVFWGAHEMSFWDCFAEPGGGYPANLPAPLGHGSVPAEILGRYSAVVWVGNHYNGDLAKWQETPILSYLEAGGNVLLLGRHLHDHLDTDLSTYLAVNWTEDNSSLTGGLTATATGFVNIAATGNQNLLDAFSTLVGENTTLLFTGNVNGTQGMGAIVAPPGGGSHRADGGRLAAICGRPYRLDRPSLRANVDYLLSNWFAEPYTPVTSVVDDAPAARVTLGANYPNPFNPQTMIPFALPAAGRVELTIHDAAGRLVRTLVSGHRPAGADAVRWDGLDDRGRPAASGTYFALMRAAGATRTRPLVLVR